MFNSHDVHDLQGKQNRARYEGWVTVSWLLRQLQLLIFALGSMTVQAETSSP